MREAGDVRVQVGIVLEQAKNARKAVFPLSLAIGSDVGSDHGDPKFETQN